MPRRSGILFDILPPRISVTLSAYKNYYLSGERELRVLADVVPKGGLCVDVGAHRGVYTFFLARISEHVVAYEPNPELATFLRRSVRRNVTVREFALGQEAGTARLAIPIVDGVVVPGWAKVVETAGCSSSPTYEIKIIRLDDEELHNVGFIKIDVEGYEEAVLHGGIGTIRQNNPVLLIEIEQQHRAKPITEVFGLIEELGYLGYFLSDGRWHRIDALKFLIEQDPRHATPDSGRYINNFLFWPKTRDFTLTPHWHPVSCSSALRPRAGRLRMVPEVEPRGSIERMEAEGVVSPANHVGKREVLAPGR